MKNRIVKSVLAMLNLMLLLFMTAQAEDLAQSIGLESVGNARELGGYACENGRVVKSGVFLRTAALAGAAEEDIRRLKEDYHLSVVIDLRMTSEVEGAPDPEIDGVRNLHLGIIDEEAMEKKRQSLTAEDMEGIDPNNSLDRLKLAVKLGVIGDQMYVNFLCGDQGKESYARMFSELLELPEGEALLFHCTQGKDRTGCAAMLILSALGVDEETILYDYVLTNTFNAQRIEAEQQMLEGMGVEESEFDLYMTAMDQVDPQYMVNALEWMKDNYGSVLGYITGELGVTEAQIEQLRDKYLEEAVGYADAA